MYQNNACVHVDGIGALLRALEDGKWHRREELAIHLSWTESRVERFVQYLLDHGFVSYRTSDKSVKIDEELLSLMKES